MKILLIGPPASGKTSLLNRLTLDDFDFEYFPTTSCDFTLQEFELTELKRVISMQIWDQGGDADLSKDFVTGVDGVILVVDAQKIIDSFADLEFAFERMNRIDKSAGIMPFSVVVTKIDLVEDEEDNYDLRRVEEWAYAKVPDNPNRVEVIGCSAMTGYHVLAMFENMGKSILETKLKSPSVSEVASSSAGVRPSSRRSSLKAPRPSLTSTMIEESLKAAKQILSNNKLENSKLEKLQAKVVLVGEAKCGKSCLLAKFLDEKKNISMAYEPTVGTDLHSKELVLHDKLVSLQIWDSAGDQSSFNIARTIYKNVDAVIFVYDITSAESFAELNTHWDNFIKYGNPEFIDDFPIVLVGAKSDLSGQRAVSMEDVLDWCSDRRHNAPITYIEASSLAGINVKDVFANTADFIVENYLLDQELPSAAYEEFKQAGTDNELEYMDDNTSYTDSHFSEGPPARGGRDTPFAKNMLEDDTDSGDDFVLPPMDNIQKTRTNNIDDVCSIEGILLSVTKVLFG